MATNAKKPRKRIDKIVWILAKIYEFDYKTTQRIYNKFNQDVEQAKVALSLEKHRQAMLNA